ncbi:hypothetical protein SEUCBS140593_001582 [Sporothrix eucalyptigena]|uniref:Uncharacterized protein n=1 Tax=Sporothrix eucalyptigena TaxID=1812306 RepID=A0ABP0AZH5_9PEZI
MFLLWDLFSRIRDVYGSWHDWLYGDGASEAPDARARIRQCRSIVDFSFASDVSSSRSIDLASRLALRAKANQHLVEALGIHNSLTTDNLATHKSFLRQATHRLKRMATPEHWRQLFVHCSGVLQQGIVDYQDNGHLPLAGLARSICLQSVMCNLFQVTRLAKEDVDTVCDEINKQWVLSKEAVGTIQQSVLLNNALARLLQHGDGPDMSPQQALELILPAYEALWRVVLLTYVTVCFRSDGAGYKQLQRVDVPSVLGTGCAEDKELLKIAKEGLRLFPSSKSIYRARSSLLDDTTTVVANVCALHRDKEIWGSDALLFPYNGFGERMIVLLVALLCTHLGQEEASIVFNNADLDDNMETELPTGRCDMEDWELTLKKGQ